MEPTRPAGTPMPAKPASGVPLPNNPNQVGKPSSANANPAFPPASNPQPNRIQHSKPAIGVSANTIEQVSKTIGSLDELSPLPVADLAGPLTARGKITAFGKDRRHEDSWCRTPNTTGSGAIHVKTFHCKLTEDALAYMDQTINEWLDAHPQYEVKFVSSTIGTLTGKLKEPALFCQVWV